MKTRCRNEGIDVEGEKKISFECGVHMVGKSLHIVKSSRLGSDSSVVRDKSRDCYRYLKPNNSHQKSDKRTDTSTTFALSSSRQPPA